MHTISLTYHVTCFESNVDVLQKSVEKRNANRGNGKHAKNIHNQNFILIYGTRPGLVVKADTKMMEEVAERMENRFDKNSFTLSIPKMFDDMIGVDADFEMISSQTLQHLKLVYEHNLVTKTIAIIFVCPYGDVDYVSKGKAARKLFKVELKFMKVQVFYMMTASQMAEKLDLLQFVVEEFKKSKHPCSLQLVAVVSIGEGMSPETNDWDRSVLT